MWCTYTASRSVALVLGTWVSWCNLSRWTLVRKGTMSRRRWIGGILLLLMLGMRGWRRWLLLRLLLLLLIGGSSGFGRIISGLLLLLLLLWILRCDIRVTERICSLWLGLRRICLVLSKVLIVRRCIRVCPRAFWLRRYKPTVRTFWICASTDS